MTKPPDTPPNSDIDGVREDEESVVDAANAAGQNSRDLKRAKDQSHGRPPQADG